jgi:hypothetical protein
MKSNDFLLSARLDCLVGGNVDIDAVLPCVGLNQQTVSYIVLGFLFIHLYYFFQIYKKKYQTQNSNLILFYFELEFVYLSS